MKSIIHPIMLAVCALLLPGCNQDVLNSGDAGASQIKVRTAQLTSCEFTKSLHVQCLVQPVDKVSVSARVGGCIDILQTREGEHVQSGNMLFQTDRRNLQRQVSVVEADLKVAIEILHTAEADLEIAKVARDKAEIDYRRSIRLFQKNVVTQDSHENAEVAWKNAVATVNRQEAVLAYRREMVAQGEVALEIARNNLSDSIIRAPLNGTVTRRYHDAGDYVAPGEKVLELEDQTRLELSAQISSLYYGSITLGSQARLSLPGREPLGVKITYVAPSIDSLSRTFEVKALLPEGQIAVTSGDLRELELLLETRSGLGLPSDAVVPRANGRQAVFAVKDGKAVELEASTGLSSNGMVEVLNAGELAGLDLVVSGQYFLADGSPVQVVK
jgi:RND family efflux transporter MFP subunit